MGPTFHPLTLAENMHVVFGQMAPTYNQFYMAGMLGTMLNVFNQIISFLELGAYIAGLVVCIVKRRVSGSMILCIMGFAGGIGVWVFTYLIGAMYGFGGMGSDMWMALSFFHTFIRLLGPLSIGILAFGLFRVFSEMKDRSRPRRDDVRRPPRRGRDDDDDYEERPAPRPRRPGGRDIER